jgi:hypothetical protein
MFVAAVFLPRRLSNICDVRSFAFPHEPFIERDLFSNICNVRSFAFPHEPFIERYLFFSLGPYHLN